MNGQEISACSKCIRRGPSSSGPVYYTLHLAFCEGSYCLAWLDLLMRLQRDRLLKWNLNIIVKQRIIKVLLLFAIQQAYPFSE